MQRWQHEVNTIVPPEDPPPEEPRRRRNWGPYFGWAVLLGLILLAVDNVVEKLWVTFRGVWCGG
jgi:hypothetical protein